MFLNVGAMFLSLDSHFNFFHYKGISTNSSPFSKRTQPRQTPNGCFQSNLVCLCSNDLSFNSTRRCSYKSRRTPPPTHSSITTNWSVLAWSRSNSTSRPSRSVPGVQPLTPLWPTRPPSPASDNACSECSGS